MFTDEFLQQVNKECDDQTVDKVREQASDERDQEIRFDGRNVFVADSLHVGHCVRSGAHAETAGSGGDDGGVIVAAHYVENDEARIESHQNQLAGQQDEHWHCKRGELPELQRDHGDSEEKGKADAAQGFDLDYMDRISAGVFAEVPDACRGDHRTDIDREGHAGF